MLIHDWRLQLIRTIIESIVMVSLGTALVKERLAWQKIILAGSIIGIVGFLLQQAPIKYGIHIPLGIITFILTLNIIFKLNILKSAAASLGSFIIVIFAEGIIVMVQTKMLGYGEEYLLGASEITKFLISLPPLLIVIILAVLLQTRLHGRVNKS